jgi:hypothetical protein
LREAKEKELFEDDPAMSTSLSVHSTTAPIANAHKNRGKSRHVNGPERRNGVTSMGGLEKRPENRSQHGHDDLSINGTLEEDRHGTWGDWTDGHNTSRYGLDHSRSTHINGVASILTRPPPSNGHGAASPSGTITPAPSRGEAFSSHSPPRHFHDPTPSEEPWTGQYTGPASGFLQGPGAPFGRVAQNPGRTIYSQQHRTD